MRRFREDERGISTVVVAVCLIAFMGAGMLTLDAGNLWSTRRMIITGSDAAVLDAARMFNVPGGFNPCEASGVAAAETHATNVLLQNHPAAIHNDTDTPDGFHVTFANPLLCGTGATYVPGKVRYDARLTAQGFFSGAFGFGNSSAISSSTAAWGYLVALGEGLRPITLCDKTDGYNLWEDFFFGRIDQATYNSHFGEDETKPFDQIRYPATSDHWVRGGTGQNPNAKPAKRNYVVPDGTVDHRTIQRVTMPSPLCGVSPGNRVWPDYTGPGSGALGASVLRDQILYGYKGTVALSPHDCNPSDGVAAPEDCGSSPGDKASLEKALGDITCDSATGAMSCPYRFPILVVNDVTAPGGANAHYVQVAFLFVVLRGFASIESDTLQFDFEFVDVQTSGEVGASPPTTDHPYQTAVQLCGVDKDVVLDRCPF